MSIIILISSILLTSCTKELLFQRIPNEVNEGESGLLENVYNIVLQQERNGRVVEIVFFDEGDKAQLFFDDSSSMNVDLNTNNTGIGYPDIAITVIDESYYWVMNGSQLSQKESFYPFNNGIGSPIVKYENGSWWCEFSDLKRVRLQSLDAPPINIDIFTSPNYILVTTHAGSQVRVQKDAQMTLRCRGVLNQSYYKDIFLDAGYGLTNRNVLPAANYLSLSLDYMSISNSRDTILQNKLVGGEQMDLNGRLLYPDGQPRYKILFVVGGDSRAHGQSLSSRSRDAMSTFYYNGGCYIGTCAGSAFVSDGFNNTYCPCYLHIWPYRVVRSGVINSSVGMYVPHNSPLLDYYSFGGDNLVANVRHNKGNYVNEYPIGAEILAFNDSTSDSVLQNKPAIWAYKKSNKSGRLVVTGSHPESYTSGERRDLMAAMLKYAIDGRGEAEIKGVLRNGVSWVMDKTTEENDPDHTVIGDLQYHHFVVYIPNDAQNVTFRVNGEENCDFRLLLSRRTIPFDNNAEYIAAEPGPNQSLLFPRLNSGIWFVSVKCNTTISSTDEDWGQSYQGRTEVLNGVSYKVTTSWGLSNNNQ